MKLIKSKFEIIEQQAGLEGIYKAIELAGRTCYKSEHLITEDSAKGFVERMINNKHYAMLEHGTVYLAIPITTYAPEAVNTYINNSYSKVIESSDYSFTDKYGDKVRVWCITTNLRVLVENNCLEDLEFICEPTEFHEKRYCVRFTCDRGVSHEFVRHRVFSFAQESTRYCNYSKNKFGNELTYIIPSWMNIKEDSYTMNQYGIHNSKDEELDHHNSTDAEWDFIESLIKDEHSYFSLLDKGWKPEQARQILPNALKTELVMTGFVSDWNHFFELRCDKAHAHPDAFNLANPLKEEFIKRNYIKE